MEEELEKALKVLKKGGVILYPTDTVWGIGCDATNTKAVSKIIKIKQREKIKSLIILIENEKDLNKYLKEVPYQAFDLMASNQKPLTIIYYGARGLASNVIHEDGSIGIRVVKDEFCLKLIRQLGKPIVSTSANISGEGTPKNFKEISMHILKEVDYIVNLRQTELLSGKASTIIKLDKNGEVKIIRK